MKKIKTSLKRASYYYGNIMQIKILYAIIHPFTNLMYDNIVYCDYITDFVEGELRDNG